MKKKKGIRAAIITTALLMILAVLFILYVNDFYHASEDVEEYCSLNAPVTITETENGLYLDGEGKESALIFYPGAKVEYTAYVPLMYEIAERGVDVFIVKMPFNLAVFGISRADDMISGYDYSHWFISGHSLGAAMAACYAAGNSDKLDGIIFLASYTTKDLKAKGLKALSIYGSEDGVLNLDKLSEGRKLLPEDSGEIVIEGGNHALFGLYGEQKGDGKATISNREQWNITAEAVVDFVTSSEN